MTQPDGEAQEPTSDDIDMSRFDPSVIQPDPYRIEDERRAAEAAAAEEEPAPAPEPEPDEEIPPYVEPDPVPPPYDYWTPVVRDALRAPDQYAGAAPAVATRDEELDWRTSAVMQAVYGAQPTVGTATRQPNVVLDEERPEWTAEQRALVEEALAVLRQAGWQLLVSPRPAA